MATVKHRDLQWLQSRVSDDRTARQYAMRLQMIASLVESECPEAVSWVVAYGPVLEKLESGQKVRYSHTGLKILAITNLPSFYESVMLLAEKVFGPVLSEFGRLVDFDVWTHDQLRHVAKSAGSTWEKLEHGVWLYGSPEPTHDRA